MRTTARVEARRDHVTGAKIDPSILERAFDPKRIAVIGASGTRGKWSNDVLRLLVHSFRGKIIPVNPARARVEGLDCYPSVAVAPGGIDYAIVVVPRDGVLDAVRQCVDACIPVVHVFSAGFAEVSEPGRILQEEIARIVSGSKTLLIGPNSMGLYSASAGLSFAWGCHFEPGPIAFVSQSGGICYDILARGQARGLKFGKILSVGNCAHADWPEYVDFLASDPDTGIIALYIESVNNGYRLYEAMRAAARVKPVVILKGGRTEQGNRSVVSHTGRLAGEYTIWRTMMRQAGVHEVFSLDELFVFCEAHEHRAQHGLEGAGPDWVTLIGTGGGATVLLTDACEDAGLKLAVLEPQTVKRLRDKVPDAGALGGVNNPIDVGADRLLSRETLLAELVEITAGARGVGFTLVHLNLVAVANNLSGGIERWLSVCSHLSAVGGGRLCVLLRNADGGEKAAELEKAGLALLREHKIPAYGSTRDCLDFISFCMNSTDTESPPTETLPVGAQAGGEASGERLLSGEEARQLVEQAGVTMAPWGLATDESTMLHRVERIGFPVALKTAAADVPHKSDAGCVRLGIRTADEARAAYREVTANARDAGSATPDRVMIERMIEGTAEVMIGLKRSASFGSSILVGLGGIWVELLKDFSVRLCPVEFDEAMEMLEELKGFALLSGARGQRRGDIEALAALIVAVSRLGHETPDLLELDLNPVMLREEGAIAVDARVVLRK